ncbi:Na(+)/dicarboxylate cotransporter 3-like [Physella acuta]|uniref:Na(+)/dicarboxylate cotransporter 3-like n=1 Tax=Physella acuta TaxID=109671 RepID=UPI0027DC7280|nr:Na(+)/dicarboxylate cotransporter 3-like [Physella acuta]
MRLVQHLRATWQTWLVLILPVLLCPMIFPFSQRSQELKCGYVVVLMTVYWITESLPLPVTALIPIVLLPLLGVVSSSRLCKVFFEDIIFLLLGGIIVAIAIEETGLHKRFALRILMAIGVQPRRLLFGIMVTTAFISMWISNTATTAMMMPVTRALLVKMFATTRKVQSGTVCPAAEGQGESTNTERETIFYTQVTERITPGVDGTEYSQPINGLQTIEDPQLITTIDQSEISKPSTSADTEDDDDQLSNLDPESLST